MYLLATLKLIREHINVTETFFSPAVIVMAVSATLIIVNCKFITHDKNLNDKFEA